MHSDAVATESSQLQLLKEIRPGETYSGWCIVRLFFSCYTQSGDPYRLLELGDRSGRLRARIWQDSPLFHYQIRTGQILWVEASVGSYRSGLSLSPRKIRLPRPREAPPAYFFLAPANRDPREMLEKLQGEIDKLTTPALKNLLRDILKDGDFREALMQAPGGKLWHHNRLGGTLEHLLEMLEIAESLFAAHHNIDRDLLKSGIICSRLGQVRTFLMAGFIEFSDEGRLLGFPAIGYRFLAERMAIYEDFPVETQKQLLHMTLSCEGEKEGVMPMSLEAVALQKIGDLSASLDAISRIEKNDVLPGEKWSKYIPLLDRFVYAGHRLKFHPSR